MEPTQPTQYKGTYTVFGPPGTGKTTYIVNQIKRALGTYSPEQIMVASFTKTAAANIAARANLPKSQVGTLHSFCFHLLGMPKVAESKEIFKAWNSDPNITAPMLSMALDPDAPDAPAVTGDVGDKLLAEYARLRATMEPRDLWPGDVANFARQWEDFKRRHDCIDFTDMIEFPLVDQIPPPSRIKIAFFDEAQDFSTLQFKLIKHWAKWFDMTVIVGDDDQTIYTYLGASETELIADLTPEKTIVLKQSYRVPPEVHKFALNWISQLGDRRAEKEYRPKEFDADAVMFVPNITLKDRHGIIDWINMYPGTKMILASASYLLNPVITALRDEFLPYHNPYRVAEGKWNPVPIGNDKTITTLERIKHFLRTDPDWWTDPKMWSGVNLKLWTDLITVKGNLVADGKRQIERLANDNRYMTTPLSIEDLLHIFTDEGLDGALNGGLEWLQNNLLKSKEKSASYLISSIRAGHRPDKPEIMVGTIHSVKGGEADHVLLFPDISPSAAREWFGDGVGHDSLVRLYYVGITRAKQSLTIAGRGSQYIVDLMQ